MKSEFVPEIHDIGKLLDKESTGIEHNFEKYPGKLEGLPKIKENATWIGIKEHHCQLPRERKGKVLEEYPKSKDAFILCIADNLASTVSRHAESKGEPFYNVYKLWKTTANVTNLSNAIESDCGGKEWIEKIINFVNKNPTTKEYFKEFGDYLTKRCEDASPGANITSLSTHSILTGKFYRILEPLKEDIGENIFETPVKERMYNEIQKKQEEWILYIIKCKIRFPQKPYRTKDMNIFKIRDEFKQELKSQFEDNILFSTSDEIVFVVRDEDEFLFSLEKDLKEYALWLELGGAKFILGKRRNLRKDIRSILGTDPREIFPYPEMVKERRGKLEEVFNEKREREISEKISSLPPSTPLEERQRRKERVLKALEKDPLYKEIEWLKEFYFERTIYSELEEEIQPHICEICQLNQAKLYESLSDAEKRLVTDEKSGVIDKLCEKCIEIRKHGESLTLLKDWTEGDVAWIKISLDFGKLAEMLKELYIDYLGTLKMENPEERAEVRPSVISEFQWDYNEFLKQFNGKIHETFDNKEKVVQDVLEDLFCIKIDKLSEGIKILVLYSNLINDFFPKFKETEESPIKLVISCSYVKFPFFEHWRYLETPKEDVRIMLIGRGEMKIKLAQLEDLLRLGDRLKNKTALEKLARMSDISEELAFMQIFSEEGIKNHPELQEALKKGFNLRDLLAYVKIKSD
jgi:hypothetical protein